MALIQMTTIQFLTSSNKKAPKRGATKKKKRQATHIAPLNHISLLPSGPGEFLQELVV